MAKMVGMSRNLKLPWLNEVARLHITGLNEKQIKNELNEYLSFEISSPTNLRKTREILMNIWVNENEDVESLREEAINIIKKDKGNTVLAHWSVMLVVYPVFADICRLIGKISEFQTEITLAQLKQKLFDEWGERTTLYHSVDKIISTMKELGVLIAEKPGRYEINSHFVNDNEEISLMLKAAMISEKTSYCSFDDLNKFSVLFPFEFEVDKTALMQDKGFEFNTFGGEVNISLGKNV